MKIKIVKIILFSLIYAVGFQLFIAPAGLLATGFAGISQILLLFLGRFGITYGVIYFIINLPCIYLAYKMFGKKMAFLTTVSIITMSLSTDLLGYVFQNFNVTDNIILDCVFGGILMGYGIGVQLRMGLSTGGTDVIGLYLLKKKNMDFSKLNLYLNGAIVLFAMSVFGLEIGLFTLLSLYIRVLAMDKVYTNNNLLTLFIVGTNLSSVNKYINHKLGRGTTILEGYGGYTHSSKDIIMTSLNQYEYRLLLQHKKRFVDAHFFINIIETKNIVGNYQIDKNSKGA